MRQFAVFAAQFADFVVKLQTHPIFRQWQNASPYILLDGYRANKIVEKNIQETQNGCQN
jgi:hypothetical protein